MTATSRASPRHDRIQPADNDHADNDRVGRTGSGHVDGDRVGKGHVGDIAVGNGRADSGMVTVEAAIALCAFVTVLAMVLAGVSMVLDEIRCTDAAREAARLVARGEQDRAAEAVGRIAPGASLSVTSAGDAITASVWDPVAGGLLPGVHVHAEAYAIREPDADDPDPGTGAQPPTPTGMNGSNEKSKSGGKDESSDRAVEDGSGGNDTNRSGEGENGGENESGGDGGKYRSGGRRVEGGSNEVEGGRNEKAGGSATARGHSTDRAAGMPAARPRRPAEGDGR